MTKYHVNDKGVPGVCTANIRDCKFGGEAQHYSSPEIAQKAFELSMASETVQKPMRKTVDKPVGVRDAESKGDQKVERYIHPQGKIAEVQPTGKVLVFKDGKVVNSSATTEKLRAGYGAWKLDTSASNTSIAPDQTTAKKLSTASSAPKTFPSPEVQEEPKTLITLHKNLSSLEKVADKRLRKTLEQIKENNNVYGFSEGRAYVNEYARDPKTGRMTFTKKYVSSRVDGYVGFDNRPEDDKKLKEDSDALRNILQKKERILSEIEDSGHGDKIPDDGKVLRVRNKAQKILLQDHLFGQISDGKWENTPGWESWSETKVIVDPKNVGRNFSVLKDNYQLNSKDLLEIVGHEMESSVERKTDFDYTTKMMNEDLKDLRNIFKTSRGPVK